MKIFLDVGAHIGETLRPARDPRWGFDRIICFEPDDACVNILRRGRDPRVRVIPAGLWHRNEERTLHHAGDVGATIFADKRWDHRPEHERAKIISLIRASEWVAANTGPDDQLYVKLNCEGCECDVLDDLMDAGLTDRIAALMVHFDVRKIPSMRQREHHTTARMGSLGIRYVDAEQVSGASVYARTERWLRSCRADGRPGVSTIIASAAYRLRWYVLPRLAQRVPLRTVVRTMLPTRLYRRLRFTVSGYDDR